MLTFGQIFGIVKSKGLNICNEIKFQTKYGSEKAQYRKEMGTFCEAFEITNIEAPSVARKRAQTKRIPFNKNLLSLTNPMKKHQNPLQRKNIPNNPIRKRRQ